MMIKLDLSQSDPSAIQEYLEGPCCGGKPTHDCQVHFLTPALKTQLIEWLNNDSDGSKAKVVAELAKYNSCRKYLFDDAIYSRLVRNLKEKNVDLLTQSCRALANLCYEFSDGQNFILSKEGFEALSGILLSPLGDSDTEKQLLVVAVGFLLNLINDNEELQKKVMTSELPTRLIELIKADLESDKASTLCQHIISVFVTITESVPMEQVLTLPVCEAAVKLLKLDPDGTFYIPALQFLEEYTLADQVKYHLVESGLLHVLFSQMEAHPNQVTEEQSAKYSLIGRVILNILSGDEAVELAYKSESLNILERLGDWFYSEHYDLVYAAALCLGNVARTDGHNEEIVNRGMHKLVMQCFKRNFCTMKMQHALLGTLRNLAITKANKSRLVDDGIMEATLPLIPTLNMSENAPVIYKLLAVWRNLVYTQKEVAITLGSDYSLIKKLVAWTDETESPWVPSETLRLLCGIVIGSRDRGVIENLLSNGGFFYICNLINHHRPAAMLMEAISACAVAGAIMHGASPGFENIVIETGVWMKLKEMSEKPVFTPQLAKNILTLLETFQLYVRIRTLLKEEQAVQFLRDFFESKEEFTSLLPQLDRLNGLT